MVTSTGVSEYPVLQNLPTHLLKFGEITDDSKYLILVLPGNPGIIEFYTEFMNVLHDATGMKIPVWGIAHTGHEILPGCLQERYMGESFRMYSVFDQVLAKMEFIMRHIPKHVKLILIGHSIGCWIILKLLKELEPTQVKKAIFLFPTLERMRDSQNGSTAWPLVTYFRWVSIFATWLASWIPVKHKKRFIYWYFSSRQVSNSVVNSVLHLFRASVVNNVTFMAKTELDHIEKLDVASVKKNISKLIMFYGKYDRWVPLQFYHEMKERFPDCNQIFLDEDDYEHAFCLHSGEAMALHVWEWVSQEIMPSNSS